MKIFLLLSNIFKRQFDTILNSIQMISHFKRNQINHLFYNQINFKIFEQKMTYIVPLGLIYIPIVTQQFVIQYTNQQHQQPLRATQFENNLHQTSQFEQNKVYWQLIKKELEINSNKFQKKIWSPEEDRTLQQLREKSYGWVQVSKNIKGTNAQVCKRRYYRIKLEHQKWSKDIDQRVINLIQKQSSNWNQINLVLKNQFGINDKKRLRQIRYRYKLYLNSSISKLNWTVNQDLKLIMFVQQHGKKWKKISKIFRDRTQLQVKNRFYGTILPIINRVLKKLKQIKVLETEKQQKIVKIL